MRYIILSILLIFSLNHAEAFYSQCGQDQFVYQKYFKKMKGGTFVDIGAHNGVTYSNTLYFEKKHGWNGICVEPIPEVFHELKKNRKSTAIQGCVADFTGIGHFLRVNSPFVNTEMLSGLLEKYDPRHLERVEREIAIFGGSYEIIEVECFLLMDLLEQQGIDHIHFLSIDTEGGELDILTSIDYSKVTIDVIAVEDNYLDSRFNSFLKSKGYELVKRCHQDLIFVRKGF